MADRIYLDTCAIQRPLDTPSNPRIVLESEAVLALLPMIDGGRLVLVSSDVLDYECDKNPEPVRQRHARTVLQKAAMYVQTSVEIDDRARTLEARGLKPLDALHLSCAVAAETEWFCTVDDGVLRRSTRIVDIIGSTRIIDPIELVKELVT